MKKSLDINNIYIAVLKEGIDKWQTGIDIYDLTRIAVDYKYLLPDEKEIIDNAFKNKNHIGLEGDILVKREVLIALLKSCRVDPGSEPDFKKPLTMEAYMSYLEYVELQEARENAVTAKHYSWWAIVIALSVPLITLCVTYLYDKTLVQDQINAPVQIDADQYNAVIQHLESISESTNQIQQKQTDVQNQIEKLNLDNDS